MVVTEGRGYNIRFGCITQFASMLDKNALRYMRQRFFGATDELNDVNYIEGFIGDKAEELKTLKAGQFIYSHPAKNILRKIQIKPHVQIVKPQRIISPSILIQQTNTNPQAHATLGSAIIWMMFLMFMLWLILRR